MYILPVNNLSSQVENYEKPKGIGDPHGLETVRCRRLFLIPQVDPLTFITGIAARSVARIQYLYSRL